METVVARDAIEINLLESEHRRIRAGLADAQEGLARIQALSRSEAMDHVVRALRWVRTEVLPHVAWEEAWVYPHLDAAAGSPWATRLLRFEHEQIRDLAGRLESEFAVVDGAWSLACGYRLAIALARLEAVITAHLAKEQWFVPPFLEAADGRTADHQTGG